jgi:SAM-dependent methyltransferase
VDRSLNFGREELSAFFDRIQPEPRQALDLGAGMGFDLSGLREHFPSCQAYGVELIPYKCAMLRHKGIVPISADIERDPLPFGDESTDVVIANQILEHLKEVFWVLHEATRVLSVGGSLILGVPNLASLHNRLLLLLGRQPTCIRTAGPHVRGYTLPDLREFLREAAPGIYCELAVRGSNFYPFPAPVARPLARLLPSLAVSLFLHFRKDRAYRGEILEYMRTHRKYLETPFYAGPGAPPLGGLPTEP